ncbi:MAG: hypothetical protein A2289_13095 [Deltaproteobacteria bacterium RIFOXYA12_FULL_58_15]|nr:MAG: hypothetical protein A2289_13095 [Deltaproteobacteria bacterium RIFOXYA12_FULL_58_15]OGR09429.1 MAG: hypothetical protein A2341_18075 [Deltaproteobacteria bacterium RIFOXYB12_FULL_58_9]
MKKAKGAKRAERGFSLIESMIAAAVFTIGSLGLLGMLVSSSQGMAVSERMTHGTVLARQKLSELTRLPYDSIATGAETTNIDAEGAAQGDLGSEANSDGWFARTWTVSQPDTTIDFKLVRVDVKWRDKALKIERQVSMSSGKSRQ